MDVAWCPTCDPDPPALRDHDILVERRCYKHSAPPKGSADEYLEEMMRKEDRRASVGDNPDPETQRAWGNFLRKGRPDA